MNILKLQDMLKGLPDARLKQELDAPNGSIPQYLVLSEVVRRQKMREEFNTPNEPQTTVLDDMRNMLTPQPQMPQPMPQMPQQPPAAMAEGGFVSPAEAFGNAGFSGRPMQPQMKPQPPMGSLSGPINLSPQTMAPQQSYQPQQQPISAPQGPMVQLQQYGQLGQPDTQQQPQQAFAHGGSVHMDGGGLTRDQIIQLIREKAVKYGIDPEVALKVAQGEGLYAKPEEGFQSFVRDDKGNREESYGIFQLNMAPGAVGDKMLRETGIHPKDDVGAAIDYALKTVRQVGWGPWMGAKAKGITGRMGINENAPTVAVDANVTPAADTYTVPSGKPGESMEAKAEAARAGDSDNDFMRYLKRLRSNFKSEAADIGDAILNRPHNYAPSGGMMRGQAPTNYAKNELDLINAYKKAAMTGADENPADAIDYFPRYGILALADGGIAYLQDGTQDPTVSDPYAILGYTREQIEEMGPVEYRKRVALTPEQKSTMTADQLRAWNDAWWKVGQEMGAQPTILGSVYNWATGAPQTEPGPWRKAEKERKDRRLGEEPGFAALGEAAVDLGGWAGRKAYDAGAAANAAVEESIASGVLSNISSEDMQIAAAKRVLERRAAEEKAKAEADAKAKPVEGPKDAATPWTPPTADEVTSGDFARKAFGEPEQKKKTEPTLADLYEAYTNEALKLQRKAIDEERRAAEEARGGGMGQFLRRLGIGVLTSPSGRFGDMLASGITNVASADEKARQQYLERAAQLREAELKYGVDAAKVPYELAVLKQKLSGGATSDEIRKYYVDRLNKLEEKETEILKAGVAMDPKLLDSVRQEKTAIQKALAGYGYPMPPQPEPTPVGMDALSLLAPK